MLLEALRQCCDLESGRATYLRLSTKPIDQKLFQPALARLGEAELRRQILAGGYRLRDWRSAETPGHKEYLVHIATSGAMIPEAVQASEMLLEEGIPANVLNLTNPRSLYEAWRDSTQRGDSTLIDSRDNPFSWLIPLSERHAPIVTVLDGASHSLAWLAGVYGSIIVPLGVDSFGQSGAPADLYQHYGIDAPAIVNGAMLALQRCGL